MVSLHAPRAQSIEREVLDFRVYRTDDSHTSWLLSQLKPKSLSCLCSSSCFQRSYPSRKKLLPGYKFNTLSLTESSIIDCASKNVVLEILANTPALASEPSAKSLHTRR